MKVYSDKRMTDDKVPTKTTRVARGAQKLVGSPPSAGSSANPWAAKSASSQQN